MLVQSFTVLEMFAAIGETVQNSVQNFHYSFDNQKNQLICISIQIKP